MLLDACLEGTATTHPRSPYLVAAPAIWAIAIATQIAQSNIAIFCEGGGLPFFK